MTITHRTAGPVAVVPTEATPKQEMAANQHWSLPTYSEDHRLSIYGAMIAAAPSEPAADLEATVRALRDARSFAVEYIDANGGVDGCEYQDRLALERIDAALAAWELTDDRGATQDKDT